MIDVRVQGADFDPGRQLERLGELGKAVVSGFVGSLEPADENVTKILVEHYAALAKRELGRIAEEASRRWSLDGVILIHRHGRFEPGTRILFLGVTCSDYPVAAEACNFLRNAVKERAPFWRKDIRADGSGEWLQP